MEIPFSGEIDVDILRRTNRAALIPPRKMLLFGVVLVLVGGWGWISPMLHGAPVSWDGVGPLLLFVLVLGGLVGYAVVAAPRKLMASNRLLQLPIRGAVSETGVWTETAHTRSDLPWDVFLRRKIGKDIVLLYSSIQAAKIFPREFFASEADWQAFVELVREHVPERAAAGPGRRFGMLKVFLLWLVVFAVVMLVWNYFH